MLFFANHQRSQEFDRIIETTDALLANPAVIAKLGAERAAHYKDLLDGSFLPDIKQGVVHLPRNQRGTNNTAIVPLIGSDTERGLHLAPSMYLPTQARFDKISVARAAGQVSAASTADILREHVPTLVDRADISRMRPSLKALTNGVAIEVAEGGQVLTPRPTVVFGVGKARGADFTVGTTATHEFVHVDDIEGLNRSQADVKDWTAFSEIKANRVTYACLEGAGVVCDFEVLDNAVLDEGFGAAIAIERARRELNPADDPYARHPELMSMVLPAQARHNGGQIGL